MGNFEKDRMFKATIDFLTRRGYDILEEDVKGFIIAMDGDVNDHPDIVFVKMYDMSTEEEPCITTSEFEAVAIPWIANSNHIEASLRYDTFGILIIGEDKAIIKHHIDVKIIK